MSQAVFKVYFLFFIFLSVSGYAQQDPSFSNYLNAGILYNPASAGAAENIVAGIFSRNQWNKIPGAPSTQTFSIHAPLAHRSVGLGGYLMRDETGPLRTLTLSLACAYRINFKRGILSFGLQGGIKQYRLNGGLLDPQDKSDESLIAEPVTSLLPDIGAGLSYMSDRVQLGFSASHLNKSRSSLLKLSIIPHYYAMGSFVLNPKGYFKWVPAFLLKAVADAPVQSDISMYARSPEVTFGLSYRTTDVISFQLLLNIEKLLPALDQNIVFGYAYDHSFSQVTKAGNGSNEFFIQYNFNIGATEKKIGRKPKSLSPKFF